jgi:hypothetical protein
MDRNTLLKEMKAGIGTQDPIAFFEKMVDVLGLLFDRIDELELDVKKVRLQSALAIQWEPRMAATMITTMIDELREDRDTYCEEISQLKKAFVEDKVTQNYTDFCTFWQEVLGWHPFLDYDK